ncbi:hypothetical protein ONZ45_g3675 [Pleurotus djamor]|nr:hypothetical protein ONZ45_g3675 [Pleurotus djamor]
MCDTNLSFSPSASKDAGSYKLLELPPELVGLVETALKDQVNPGLKIKGVHKEDAVLCTQEKTYSMRSVLLSNSVLVVTPPIDDQASDNDTVIIRDTLNEIIELAPVVPKLYKLTGLLRGREYDESSVDEPIQSVKSLIRAKGGSGGEVNGRWLTYDEAMSEIQASDNEMNKGLEERRVLIINGYLRPISRPFLVTILELILNLLVSLSLSPSHVPINDLASTLADEHEIPIPVTHQIMNWFGETDFAEDRWAIDMKELLKEIGLGLLRDSGREGIPEDAFMTKWKTSVGDTFEKDVSMDLLLGNYISSPPPFSVNADAPTSNILSYYPRLQLPVDPPARFSELFLTRARWRADEIAPFLSDIAVDAKDRDRLVLKYARAITESDGIWYTARVQYS